MHINHCCRRFLPSPAAFEDHFTSSYFQLGVSNCIVSLQTKMLFDFSGNCFCRWASRSKNLGFILLVVFSLYTAVPYGFILIFKDQTEARLSSYTLHISFSRYYNPGYTSTFTNENNRFLPTMYHPTNTLFNYLNYTKNCTQSKLPPFIETVEGSNYCYIDVTIMITCIVWFRGSVMKLSNLDHVHAGVMLSRESSENWKIAFGVLSNAKLKQSIPKPQNLFDSVLPLSSTCITQTFDLRFWEAWALVAMISINAFSWQLV